MFTLAIFLNLLYCTLSGRFTVSNFNAHDIWVCTGSFIEKNAIISLKLGLINARLFMYVHNIFRYFFNTKWTDGMLRTNNHA